MRAARIAAALACLMQRQGRRFSLTLFNQNPGTHLPPGSTRRHLMDCLSTMENRMKHSSGLTNAGGALNLCAPMFKRRGSLIVISDFFTDLDSFYTSLAQFQHRGFDILPLHVTDSDERLLPNVAMAQFVDMESGISVEATPDAGTMVADRPSGAEVFVLSDFQRAGWADISFESIPTGVRLFFVDVSGGERERPNTALLRVTPSSGVVSAREPVRLEILAANYSPTEITLPLEAIVDGRLATPGEMKIPAWSTGRTSLEIAAPGTGVHGIEVRTPDDALPADNRRWARLDVREREEVLVVSDDNTEDSGAKFVLAALDPYDGKGGPFTVRRVATTDVTPQQIGTASRIVLTGVAMLKEELVQRLAGFMEQGGGVLWFLDGTADTQNPEALNSAAGGTFIPFQLAGKLTTENFGGTPQKVARGKFDSRYLRLFRGAGRQSLGLLEFYAMQRALPTANGSVLLSFADGMPAQANTSKPGAGRR